MNGLRIASLFVAVISGDYAALAVIDDQLIDFGVTAAICAGSVMTAWVIAHADNRRRRAAAPGRAAVGLRRDSQVTTRADLHCPSCRGTRQQLSDSPGFADRQAGVACQACTPAFDLGPT
ncbi:hypothetical protein A5641_07965 [Mycobacterium sp. 1554424.7]|nr:hypothetical protein A5641_07965 [Mycobacterium sp. 1554424.7]